MPRYPVPVVDEALAAEVAFFQQWGFLLVRSTSTASFPRPRSAAD